VARPTKEIELRREQLEGQLACLGSALVLIQLAEERVGVAIRYIGHVQLLNPAIEDLSTARNHIRRAQGMVKRSSPSVFGSE
jgi:hypothetical protein